MLRLNGLANHVVANFANGPAFDPGSATFDGQGQRGSPCAGEPERKLEQYNKNHPKAQQPAKKVLLNAGGFAATGHELDRLAGRQSLISARRLGTSEVVS